MKIKKMTLLILTIGIFFAVINTFGEIQSLERNNFQNQNFDEEAIFNFGAILSTAATGISAYNIGMAINAINSSNLNYENDIGTKPIMWDKIELKYWEIIAVAAFMANETREIKNISNGNNGYIKNLNYEKSPIGKMEDTKDMRSKIIINLFKVVGNITDNVGRTLSNILAAFLLLMGTTEILIGILKGVLEVEDINSTIIIQISKNMIPKIAVIGIIFLFLANSFFWNFYTGALFNFSMKIGGILSGQNFNMKNFPNYLTKLFDVPFSIMVQGIKMMFNIQGVVNNIMPLILLFSGILFLYFIFKAAVEIMSILIDYLVIGCFSMCIIIFSVLKITKNIGTGVVGAVIYAMTNVIVLFLLAGISFSLTDKIEKHSHNFVSNLSINSTLEANTPIFSLSFLSLSFFLFESLISFLVISYISSYSKITSCIKIHCFSSSFLTLFSTKLNLVIISFVNFCEFKNSFSILSTIFKEEEK